jgi:two-component system nitrate/nitrite response regulator NarL
VADAALPARNLLGWRFGGYMGHERISHERTSNDTDDSASTSVGHLATIVVADDEWMFRASLRQLLTAPPSAVKDVYGVDIGGGFKVIGEAGSGQDTVAIVESASPDLLLLDLDMPRLAGLDVMRALHAGRRTVRTIVLSGEIKKSELFSVVQLGARGVVLKDAPTELLFEAIMCVMAGRRWLDQALVADLMEMVGTLPDQSSPAADRQPFSLTPREREVLALVVAGYANKEIARACDVSEETIKHHLTRMFDKVGASNRLELAMLATESRLLDGSSSPPKSLQPAGAHRVLRDVVTSG